jgi:hypothetical protein
MKKEEIYVVIDSEEKRLRAIQILSDAKENPLTGISTDYTIDVKKGYIYLHLYKSFGWFIDKGNFDKQEISLDQLEQMLNPQFVVKDVILPIEELQKQAELHGWKLVKEEREIKVGDFGKFFDGNEKDSMQYQYGFLAEIYRDSILSDGEIIWNNFRHLTDEEKANIQENW